MLSAKLGQCRVEGFGKICTILSEKLLRVEMLSGILGQCQVGWSVSRGC